MTETEIVCGNCGEILASHGDCDCLRDYDREAPYAAGVVGIDHYTLGRVYVVGAPGEGEPDPPPEHRADPAGWL